MILPIVKYGHPILRTKGKEVREITAELRELAQNMIESMKNANGVGLAAQQVGVPLQLAIVDVARVEDRPSALSIDGKSCRLEDWMPMVLLNPKIVLGEEREIAIEGCLSFPELTADVDRARSVKATATLLDGGRIEFEASGLLARALQHEVDHLNGILFIDRVSSATKATLGSKLKRLQRELAEEGG